MLLDRKISLILIGIFAFFYIYSFQYTPESVSFPRFLLWVFLIFAILLFIFPKKNPDYDIKTICSKEKVMTAVLLITYAILFPILGFFVTSFLFIVIYMWYFSRKGLKKYMIIALSYMLVVYFVFQKLLYVWFPKGFLM